MTEPRSLADPEEQQRRRGLLGSAHLAPLAAYCDTLRRPGVEVPDLDPLDGGVDARLLLLLEKPGPKTSPDRGGTGFVSFDNPDPTARASRRFAEEAGIERRSRIVWNVCPWWNGTTDFRSAEGREGIAELPRFLELLPSLRVAVCVGRRAEAARPLLEGRGLTTFASAHPSGQVRASHRSRWNAIPGIWRDAWEAARQS